MTFSPITASAFILLINVLTVKNADHSDHANTGNNGHANTGNSDNLANSSEAMTRVGESNTPHPCTRTLLTFIFMTYDAEFQVEYCIRISRS